MQMALLPNRLIRLLGSGAPQNYTVAATKRMAAIGWLIPLTLGFIGLGLGTIFSYHWFAIFAAGLFYGFTFYKSARSPDVFRVYAFERMVSTLNAGWYMQIPGFFQLEAVDMKYHEARFQDDSVYVTDPQTDQPTYASVSGNLQFHPMGTKPGLRAQLMMPPGEMREQARQMCITRTHHKLGQWNTMQAVQQLGTVEEELKKELADELNKYGYKFRDFEINIKLPTVETEADGRARGRAAESISAPLRDNWPASAVQGITEAAEAARDILGTKRKKSVGGQSSDSGTQSESQQLAERIEQIGVDRIRGLLDQHGG